MQVCAIDYNERRHSRLARMQHVPRRGLDTVGLATRGLASHWRNCMHLDVVLRLQPCCDRTRRRSTSALPGVRPALHADCCGRAPPHCAAAGPHGACEISCSSALARARDAAASAAVPDAGRNPDAGCNPDALEQPATPQAATARCRTGTQSPQTCAGNACGRRPQSSRCCTA